MEKKASAEKAVREIRRKEHTRSGLVAATARAFPEGIRLFGGSAGRSVRR
jgi:hypothetical protein